MNKKASLTLVVAVLIVILAITLAGCNGIPGISSLQPPVTATAAPVEPQIQPLLPTPIPIESTQEPQEEAMLTPQEQGGGKEESEPLSPTSEEGKAIVDSIEILVSGSMPVELQVAARGSHPDKCTEMDQIETQRDGNTFRITLTTKQSSHGSCPSSPVPFEQKIPLDVNNLPAGLYTVDVNGVIGTFEFAMDNTAPAQAAEPKPQGSDGIKNSISGIIWHDLCAVTSANQSEAGCIISTSGKPAANGILETGEPGLEGVIVSLKQGECSSSNVFQTTITDSKGKYIFKDIPAGKYCVWVDVAQSGNRAILQSGTWTYPSSQNGMPVSLAEGDEKSNLNFGWDYQSEIAAAAPTDFQFMPAINPTQALAIPTFPTAAPFAYNTPGPAVQPAPMPYPQATLPPPYGSASCINVADLVSESTAPSGPTYQAGMNIVKTWRVRNTGTCVWQTGYSLVFVGGDQMSAASPTVLSGNVSPNSTVDISVQISAPMQTGVFTSQWMLRSPSGEVFGLGNGANQPLIAQITIAGFPAYQPPSVKPGFAEDIQSLGPPTWVDTFWNDANWNMLNDENTYWKVQDGALYMTARKKVDIDRWGMSRMPAIQDFYLEMEVKTGPVCGGFDSYGMVVRAPDYDTGYIFGVTCNGSYRLYQWDHGYFKSIQPYTSTKYLKVGAYKTNRLGIMAVGDNLRLYINGYFIAEYTNDWFDRGQFGLMIGPNQTQNFTVAVPQIALWQFR